MPDFIPRSDNDFASYTRNFAQQLAASPEAYVTDPATAADVLAKQQAFEAAYLEAAIPSTRCDYLIKKKSRLRAELEKAIRPVAGTVRASSAVTEENVILIGLRRRSKKHTKVGPPRESPRVDIVRAHGPMLTIKVFDRSSLHHRGKPKHVQWASLYMCTDTVLTKDSQWRYIGSTTDIYHTINAGNDLAPGTWVWIKGYWMGRRNQKGPVSEPVYTRIGFEGGNMRQGVAA